MLSSMKTLLPRISCFLLFLILPSASIYAQAGRKLMAQKYMADFNYSDAAVVYNDLARVVLRKKNRTRENWAMLRLAAESNRLSGNYRKAEFWYEKLHAFSQDTEEDKIAYVQVLRFNNKHKEAQTLIGELVAGGCNSRLLKEYQAQADYVWQLMRDSIRYKVTEVEFNSGMGDFAPAFGRLADREVILFTSSRRNTGFLGRRYGWDGKYFLDCYYSELQDEASHSYSRRSRLMKGKLKSFAHDGPLTFSHDGKWVLLTRNSMQKSRKKEVVRLMLYFIPLDQKGRPGEPKPFVWNNPDYSVGHATMSADGKTLYFCSDMPGGVGGTDIYRCRWENGTWGQPDNLGAPINTPGDELFPYISQQGKLFFASDGHLGLGGLDVFEATGVAGHFTNVTNMGYPLNSHADDFALITDSTDEFGFFSSNRKDLTDRIFKTSIRWPEFILDGIVVDKDENESPIPGARVTVKNITTGEDHSLMADSSGKFYLSLPLHCDFEIVSERENYDLVNKETVSTQNKINSERLPVELGMTLRTIHFTGIVKDKETGNVLSNARVTLTNLEDGKISSFMTDSAGAFSCDLMRNCDFKLVSGHKGYVELTETMETRLYKGKNKRMDLLMSKIHVGDVFAVKDIYYDYNKATLRDSSKLELNKLATFLIENSIKVELSSHTDSRGSDSYNKSLSQRRAQSCVNYLIQQGVPATHIIAKGYGETRLVNRCANGVVCDEIEHQQNRRTEVKILKLIE